MQNNLSAERKITALLTEKITQLAEFGNRISGLSLLPVALLLRLGQRKPVCLPPWRRPLLLQLIV
jgi:hypothetical protein